MKLSRFLRLRIVLRKSLSFASRFKSYVTSLRFKAFLSISDGCNFGKGCRFESDVKIKATDGGEIRLGEGVYFSSGVKVIAQGGAVFIGDNVFLGPGTIVVSKKKIIIGDDALIAEYVTIRDQNHRVSDQLFRASGFDVDSIYIGKNVWLGAKSTVLKGVKIGSDSIVAAHALVNRDVGARSIVAGVPAKKIKLRD